MTTRARLFSIGRYCYLWLMVGFFLGTLVLVGPVRVITSAIRARGWSEGAESLVMITVIALYVIASAAIAWWIHRRMAVCAKRPVRIVVPVSLTIAAALCLWGWFNPTVLAGVAGSEASEVTIGAGGPQFVFGPYPDSTRLAELKRNGFTAVVSLQHPAILPFEPSGIAEEQRAAGELGLTFINAPMVPWLSANEESLEIIRQLAHNGAGKYYVHCGLGRDRVNLVKRVLENEGVAVAEAAGFIQKAPRSFERRRQEHQGPMERGDFVEIDKDVWLIPYPNEPEFYAHIVSGDIKYVFLLLDSTDPQQRGWLSSANTLLQNFGIPHAFDSMADRSADHLRAIAARARTLPRPAAIVVPFTAPRTPTDVADAFMRAFGGSTVRGG